jgi:hypothetical protein
LYEDQKAKLVKVEKKKNESESLPLQLPPLPPKEPLLKDIVESSDRTSKWVYDAEIHEFESTYKESSNSLMVLNDLYLNSEVKPSERFSVNSNRNMTIQNTIEDNIISSTLNSATASINCIQQDTPEILTSNQLVGEVEVFIKNTNSEIEHSMQEDLATALINENSDNVKDENTNVQSCSDEDFQSDEKFTANIIKTTQTESNQDENEENNTILKGLESKT